MDDETRAQYEGFRPGVYVRVEVRLVYVIQSNSMRFQALRSCAKVRISLGKGARFWID